MPKFLTISPTGAPGKKQFAWNNFRIGGYVAIGWLSDTDLTGKTMDEVEVLIRKKQYSNESSAIESFLLHPTNSINANVTSVVFMVLPFMADDQAVRCKRGLRGQYPFE